MSEDLEARQERFRQRYAELKEALEEGRIAGPLAFVVPYLISAAIGTAISIGTSLLVRALTPATKRDVGKLTGEMFVQRAGPGEFISEVYGRSPYSRSSAFAASTALALNAIVRPTTYSGFVHKVITAGTTGGSEPSWSATSGGTTTSGSVTFEAIDARGGVKFAPILLWMSAIRKEVRTERGSQGGGKGGGPKVETQVTEYLADFAHLWARGPLDLLKLTAVSDILIDNTPQRVISGVLDDTIPPDDTYDFATPPDPNTRYTRPYDRFDGGLLTDGTGTRTGTINAGGNSNTAIYPGNALQLPDPIIEAAIDAKYGIGSTPAYRHRAYTRHASFYFTKYQGAMPPMTGLWEHQTIGTLQALFEHWCGRVGLLASDYDFSGVASVDLRGLYINNRYSPASVAEALLPVFNFYTYEADKIYAKLKGQASVATIDDSKFGWTEEDSDDGEVLPELDYTYPTETDIPRRVELRFISPDRDFEPNMLGDARQITKSERIKTIEAQVCLTDEEAREATARGVYEGEVTSVPLSGTLSWEYLWANAGDVITVPRDEGFTETIQIVSIKKCIGPLEIEFVRVESAVFTQPVKVPGTAFEIPPAPIPAMTIVQFFDTPLLRDAEAYVNGGSGWYAGVVKRTGDGAWNGAGLYVDKGLGYELLETFEAQATIGRAVTVLTGTTKTTEVVADTVTVDLYGDEATLESTTRENLMRGAGACLIGSEVCQILTATLDGSNPTLYPNRWNLTIGLRGIRGTESEVKTHVINERFVLINDALKFVPVNVNEVNTSRNYKAVTSGQSQADAAVVPFAWPGGTLKPLAPSVRYITKNNALDLYLELDRNARIASTLRDYAEAPLAEEVEEYVVEIYDSAT